MTNSYTQLQMIEAILNGDTTAFDNYSRWDIFMADVAGEFGEIRRNNDEIRKLLDQNEDSCYESL